MTLWYRAFVPVILEPCSVHFCYDSLGNRGERDAGNLHVGVPGTPARRAGIGNWAGQGS
jgi:hypothetical protein